MADELRRKIQLHKKGDKNDQWIPLTAGSCVQLTDYKNDGITDGAIKNAVDDANGEFDDLNTALMKLENRKPNKEDLADVAFSGDYNDLENLPDIQSIQPDWEEEDSESTSYIQNKPNLHSVATSGDYEDLENKPTIPDVNNSSITLTVNGESFTDNSFTLNQSANKTIDIPLPSFMKFITSITSYGDLPSATKSRVGNVYKVASEFTYNTDVLAKVGDLFICANPSTNVYEWVRIPSGDENYARVANGVDGLCPALPNDNTKFLNGVGNWAVPVDTNTTYTLSFSNGTLTLTPSEGQAQTFNIPNDNTTYSISFSNGVLTLTPSSGNAQTINIPNDNTTYTMSFANGVLTLTPSSGNAQTINIPDTKVTSSANHYTPSTDNSSDINGALASGDTIGAYAIDTTYNVVTGVKAKTDGKGHITDLILTKQAIKDTGGGGSMTDSVVSVNNGSASIAFKYCNNYFVGISNNDAKTVESVMNGSPVNSLTITFDSVNNVSEDFEANVFFTAGDTLTKVNLPQGFLVVGEEPLYEEGSVYIASFYKGSVIFGEIPTYNYIRLRMEINQNMTDEEALESAVGVMELSFTDSSSLSANLFEKDANTRIFTYKYPKSVKLDNISMLGYSGAIEYVEITEKMEMVTSGFRTFQSIGTVSLPNAVFNSMLRDDQLFNLGATTELYVPNQPVCQLHYLNLSDNAGLTPRSIENVSYWLGDATGESSRYVSFSSNAWAQLSNSKQTEISNRIQGKNWIIKFDESLYDYYS